MFELENWAVREESCSRTLSSCATFEAEITEKEKTYFCLLRTSLIVNRHDCLHNFLFWGREKIFSPGSIRRHPRRHPDSACAINGEKFGKYAINPIKVR